MKKAKLMLSAIAILAVVGTAFAFSANKFTKHFIYTGTRAGGVCTQTVTGAALSNFTNTTTTVGIVAGSTTSLGSGCPDVFTADIDN